MDVLVCCTYYVLVLSNLCIDVHQSFFCSFKDENQKCLQTLNTCLSKVGCIQVSIHMY